jgi:2-desacetyl-2-hydroxyethyl bacteriochlorophyllide A dehydrogenase
MLQVNLYGPGDFRVDDTEEPRCGPDDVLVRVSRCGICGTDLAYVAAGGLGPLAAHPMPLGHELCGRVAAVGECVQGIREGLHVAVNPMAAGNMIGNGGPEGGLTNTLRVRYARLGDTLHALPDGLTDEQGALVEPLAVAMHAVNVGEAGAGDSVVVLGAGAIGLGVIAALRAKGVTDVVAVDLSKQRLERALRMGARATVDANEDFFGAVGALHGTSAVFAEPVLDTRLYVDASGAGSAVENVLTWAGHGARLVIAGLHKHEVPVSLRNVMAREIRIMGALGYPSEFPDVIALLAAGRFDVSAMVSHRFPLRDFPAAFAMASNPHEAGKVMLTMAEA